MGQGNPGGASIGDRIQDAADTATSGMEGGGGGAAETMKSAADYIGEKVGNLPGSESVHRTATAAAESVSAGADYLRDADINRMAADLEDLVRQNPGPSLLVAGVLGFLIGRAMSR